ncbi:MAG: hypothetical protein KC766_31960 [Myxococcales bacterium]|nr:hypothetical protein [Myxococcales bacterium]
MPKSTIAAQAETLACAAETVGRVLRALDEPVHEPLEGVVFEASENPLDRVARELTTWLARERRELRKLELAGDPARLRDARGDHARLWEIAVPSLRALGRDLSHAENLAQVIAGFPTQERIALDAESSVDQRAMLENEFEQVKLRVRLGLLRLAASASGDEAARWDEPIDSVKKQQTALELERIELVRQKGEGHSWQDEEAAGKAKLLSGETAKGKSLVDRAAAARARYDAIHKFGPLAPLRGMLQRIEDGTLSLAEFPDSARARRWTKLQSLLSRRSPFILGSSHHDDDLAVASALFRNARQSGDLLLVVAPRNILRGSDIVADLSAAGFKVESVEELDDLHEPEVVVLDVLGFLMPLYQQACGAFIGGGLHGVRDHNYFEPLLFGTPTWTGPHHYWSPERWRLLQAHAPELVRVLAPAKLDRLPEELILSDNSSEARVRRRRRIQPFLEEAERRAVEGLRSLPSSKLDLLRQLRAEPELIETCPEREELVYWNFVKFVTSPNAVTIEGDWQPYWRLTNHVGYLLDLLDG